MEDVFNETDDTIMCETSLCLGPMWLEVCLFVLLTLLLLNLIRCIAMSMCERNAVKVINDEYEK